MKVVRELHYGVDVWVSKDVEALRKTDCLCLNCTHMMVCRYTKVLYETCKEGNLALAVTRCLEFTQKSK